MAVVRTWTFMGGVHKVHLIVSPSLSWAWVLRERTERLCIAESEALGFLPLEGKNEIGVLSLGNTFVVHIDGIPLKKGINTIPSDAVIIVDLTDGMCPINILTHDQEVALAQATA